jgi:hypothetical protein
VTGPGSTVSHHMADAQPESSLASRLGGGIAPSAQRSLPRPWPYSGQDLATPQVRQLMMGLSRVRMAAGLTLSDVHDAIDGLGDELSAHRPLMLLALFFAGDLPLLAATVPGWSASDPVDCWMVTCWIAEAAWIALHSPLTDQEFAEGDRELLIPLTARCRFLALSEPMRWRAERGSPWQHPDDGSDPPVERVFGTDSWNLLVDRCRAARRAWSDCLDAYQSHVYLSQARPHELELEFRELAFRRPGASPLGLSVQPLDDLAPLATEDSAVIDEVTDRHLLPRFDLRSVAALAIYDDLPRRRRARLILGAGAAAAGLAAAVCTGLLPVHQALVLSAACYALIIAGVICFGTRWAAPWLLRLPAAAAVGVALVSFLPGGWLRTPHDGWLAVLALAAAACGYLVIEARNHGVAGRALPRSLAVAGIGAVHALMVSVIGLVAIAPVLVGRGGALAALWHRPGYGHAGMVLLLATAWCLAVGVFSQILWDDRPITAPLAHLSWRSGL